MQDKQPGALTLLADPAQRIRFMRDLVAMDGHEASLIEQDDRAYGIISLTALGAENEGNATIKTILRERQAKLATALARADIKFTDPLILAETHPIETTGSPDEIFKLCSGHLLRARFVTFGDTLPSTGGGIELEMARRLGKFICVFHDPRIRTSRMQPNRALHLSVHDYGGQASELAEIFSFLREHDPCLALREGRPVMAGVHQETGAVVNLEEIVRKRWPALAYQYDPTTEAVSLGVQNPDIFREHLRK